MAMECRLASYDLETEHLVNEIVNVNVGESVLPSDGKMDMTKLNPIVFDPINSTYLKLGRKVGNALRK